MTESTAVTVTARADRFLGGDAGLPVGTVRLDGGDWEHRLSVASRTGLDESRTVGLSAVARLSETGEDIAVRATFDWRF